MMWHVRRKMTRLFPAAPEISIPISAVLQTSLVSITLTTFHFSSVLTLGVTVATARWPHSLPAQVLVTILASALSDRSRVVRLKLRRTR